MKISIHKMSEDLKWKGTGILRWWQTKIQNFLMGQEVLDIANEVDPQSDAWISPSTTTSQSLEDWKQQERTLKADHNWRVREQNTFYTIEINYDEEICCRYNDIKLPSAVLEKLKENSINVMLNDTESIETWLFTRMLEDYGNIRSYYNEMRKLCEYLESCNQPRSTDP